MLLIVGLQSHLLLDSSAIHSLLPSAIEARYTDFAGITEPWIKASHCQPRGACKVPLKVGLDTISFPNAGVMQPSLPKKLELGNCIPSPLPSEIPFALYDTQGSAITFTIIVFLDRVPNESFFFIAMCIPPIKNQAPAFPCRPIFPATLLSTRPGKGGGDSHP